MSASACVKFKIMVAQCANHIRARRVNTTNRIPDKDLKNSDGMEIDRKMERFYSILSLQLDFHHAQKMHFEISGFEDLKLA